MLHLWAMRQRYYFPQELGPATPVQDAGPTVGESPVSSGGGAVGADLGTEGTSYSKLALNAAVMVGRVDGSGILSYSGSNSL